MLDLATRPVSEIMTTDVLTLDADATIREALETLEDYAISGAPVVDGTGKCVGVFSITDLVRRDQEVEEGQGPLAIGWYQLGAMTDVVRGLREELDGETTNREVVGDWMTRDPKSVPPDATVADAARLMADEGIHRVLIMEGPKLAGIVSSLDLVELIARAGERAGGRAARGAPRKPQKAAPKTPAKPAKAAAKTPAKAARPKSRGRARRAG
jgi:CBS domain-containing protein